MVSVCLPSDALLQHLLSYLGFSYLGRGVSLHSCSSKAQPLLLTLDEGYLLTTALPDLQRGIAPLGPLVPEKARDFQKNICFCFIDYAKAFDCVDHHKLWKILKEMGIPDHLTCLLRNLYAGQEATVLELDMEQHTGYKSGREYVKAVYCHPAYLTYMQSTSCKVLFWMKHKLE